MDIVIDMNNYTKTDTIFNRVAARGIIHHEDKYLLIFSRYGDYKFPGGGVEKGEELTDTLIREVHEETGYNVIADSIVKFGKVLEKRAGMKEDLMIMESYYFTCDVTEDAGARDLDDYEAEYDYQVVWTTLEEAIARNRKVTDLETCPWVVRDTKVMEEILAKGGA